MLTLALQFKDAFPLFQKRGPHYKHLPSVEDWNRVELVCEVLEVFSVSTKMISGSEYPTSNLFLSEIYRVKEVLEKKTNDQNIFMKEMIKKMRAKFDKYWGECNLLMAFGAILDPRCKMRFIEFCFPLIYPKDEVATNIASIRGSLYELYNEYAPLLASNVDEHNEEVVSQSTGTSSGSLANSLTYRVLSLMACDILAIPITRMASESTFSAGGRVIDTYRASLSTDTVQALVCGGDWVRHKFGIKKKPRKRDNTLFEEEILVMAVAVVASGDNGSDSGCGRLDSFIALAIRSLSAVSGGKNSLFSRKENASALLFAASLIIMDSFLVDFWLRKEDTRNVKVD
ncbi:zinc finger BED domain-containing protein RICESLEEPER 2-like [Quillaja saponaria]|uniref:Zinc finger BED domain-containing protein RICESLEEPER 2-like n=1 Tax=Quillaja saponaria TaxID=32244 RepID=A0AAD7Q503_QUISA|nr:zinc finger BED domain-containing protein RICESLEEPER 2-like [Quillaja saponaria]